MKNDLNDLKKLTLELMENDKHIDVQKKNEHLIEKIYNDRDSNESKNDNEILALSQSNTQPEIVEIIKHEEKYDFIEDIEEQEQETLSLHDKELELIKKSLDRHSGKRKLAADELGISERTLYRKIKQYDL